MLEIRIEGVVEQFLFNRLTQVIIHTSLETTLPVALEGIGRHGDDGSVPPVALPVANAGVLELVMQYPSIGPVFIDHQDAKTLKIFSRNDAVGLEIHRT